MTDKRAFNRYTLWFPVIVDAGSREVRAVCHDASAGGILISGSDKLEVGDAVLVSFRTSIEDREECKMSGRIVRVERPDEDPRSVWPHRMAIEFVEPSLELQQLFNRASSRPPPGL